MKEHWFPGKTNQRDKSELLQEIRGTETAWHNDIHISIFEPLVVLAVIHLNNFLKRGKFIFIFSPTSLIVLLAAFPEPLAFWLQSVMMLALLTFLTSQLLWYLNDNHTFEKVQSGVRTCHSTKTALLRVYNELLLSCKMYHLNSIRPLCSFRHSRQLNSLKFS